MERYTQQRYEASCQQACEGMWKWILQCQLSFLRLQPQMTLNQLSRFSGDLPTLTLKFCTLANSSVIVQLGQLVMLAR